MQHNDLNRLVIFTDLDDTLFQSAYKMDSEMTKTPMALNTSGEHAAFASPHQKYLFKLLSSQPNALLIPITGRNTEALSRVFLQDANIAFNSLKAVSHGALVLSEDNTIHPDWLIKIEKQLTFWEAEMQKTLQSVKEKTELLELDICAHINYDQNIPCYIDIKINHIENIPHLNLLNDAISNEHSLDTHINSRKIALKPPYASKARALEFIREKLRISNHDILIGSGDSITDLPFMKKADFLLIPKNSQIVNNLF